MTLGSGIVKTALPKGFFASGIHCGVRKYRPDLGLITSEQDMTVAAVYTENSCLGAHIEYCKELLPAENIRALITNSGQANTAMGDVGRTDNLHMANCLAEVLKVDPPQVLTASTGVIGQRMEIDKIVSALPNLVEDQTDNASNFATAILTTDLVPKTVTADVELKAGTVTITGIAKGSGMIHPNMATMLAYLLSDVKLTKNQASEILTDTVAPSFNMISVDGETSTNDTVYLMANGASGIELDGAEDLKTFQDVLLQISVELAKSVVQDGEGATKLIEVRVKNAESLEDARKWARSITVSPLVKTAIHGMDPNWGRIIARLGQEGLPPELFQKLDLSIQGVCIFSEGSPKVDQLEQVQNYLKKDEILVEINLKSGTQNSCAWGCDLSKKYVEINAEYTT